VWKKEGIWFCVCESKMWASAEGGAPEVTLETSMGSFTVEVVLSSIFSFQFHY
jgi:peptidyl-prolyl cis-trans isomerase-like 1